MNRAACLLYVIVAVGASPGGLFADDPVVFHSDVSLVRVDAQVLDRDNRAITGLHIEDFVLREEGRKREIRNFASEDMPVDVLFLLDVSASMRPHVELIANAAHDALRVLGKNDRVGIMVFDRMTRVRLPFNNDKDNVEHEFDRLLRQESFRGGTDITRGMLDAADYIGRNGRRDARRAIVILTDDETEFDRDDARVTRALVKADAVMSALISPDAMHGMTHGGMGGQGGPPMGGSWPGGGMGGSWPGGMGGSWPGGRMPGGRHGGGPMMGGSRTRSAGTAEIARESGGDSLPVYDASSLEITLSRLRQRYALYFQLPPGARAGQERTIQISLTGAALHRYPEAQLRFRHTYIAAESVPGQDTESAEPVSVSRATAGPAETNDHSPVVSERPTIRRRPAVSGPGEAPGPMSEPKEP